MPYSNGVARPSEHLAAYLAGTMPEAPSAVKSWGLRYIYDRAVMIKGMAALADRQHAIAQLPEYLQDAVKLELKRIW